MIILNKTEEKCLQIIAFFGMILVVASETFAAAQRLLNRVK